MSVLISKDIDVLSIDLTEHDKQIRADFAHQIKEIFNSEFPSNYPSTKPFFTLDNARELVDIVLKEQNK